MPSKPHRVIFSPDEVRAYMAGRKTQFRRVIKPQPPEEWGPIVETFHPAMVDSDGELYPGKAIFGASDEDFGVKCPFGRPGDPLYVAETWTERAWRVGMVHRPYLDSGINCCGDSLKVFYRADGESKYCEPWESSTTMPRWASRLKPVVSEVRVQQVQDISIDDGIAEGVWANPPDAHGFRSEVRLAFREQWDSRNSKPAHTWDANPWVWAVTIKPPPPQMEELFGIDITHGVDSVEHVRNMRD